MNELPDILTQAFAFMGALSVALAAAKPLLAMLPASYRPWVDAVMYVLDKLAANSKPLHERPMRPARSSFIPPPPPPGYDPRQEDEHGP